MKVVEGRGEIDDVDSFLERLAEIETAHDCTVQAFDARYLAGREHLEAAVDRAERAFERDDTIADDLAIEILCYAAGRRQIDRAMAIGVKPEQLPLAIVIVGGDQGGAASQVSDLLQVEPVLESVRDESLLTSYFNITAEERQATDASLEDLVIERVSLLAIDK